MAGARALLDTALAVEKWHLEKHLDGHGFSAPRNRIKWFDIGGGLSVGKRAFKVLYLTMN